MSCASPRNRINGAGEKERLEGRERRVRREGKAHSGNWWRWPNSSQGAGVGLGVGVVLGVVLAWYSSVVGVVVRWVESSTAQRCTA